MGKLNNGNLPASPQTFAINDVGDVEGSSMYEDSQGLTKREYFAGLAMQGLITSDYQDDAEKRSDVQTAILAVKQADALLAELEKPVN